MRLSCLADVDVDFDVDNGVDVVGPRSGVGVVGGAASVFLVRRRRRRGWLYRVVVYPPMLHDVISVWYSVNLVPHG